MTPTRDEAPASRASLVRVVSAWHSAVRRARMWDHGCCVAVSLRIDDLRPVLEAAATVGRTGARPAARASNFRTDRVPREKVHQDLKVSRRDDDTRSKRVNATLTRPVVAR